MLDWPWNAFITVVAGVFGLLIGSFLNVVAYRVPAGTSLLRASRCPSCDAAIRPWHNVPLLGWLVLRGRCAQCKASISWRYPAVEAITGVAFASVAWWSFGIDLEAAGIQAVWAWFFLLVAYLYFAAISIVLTLIDLDTRRLPNAIVLPSYIVALTLLTLVSMLSWDFTALLRAVIGMVAMYAFYWILRLVRPGGMGGGDVKLGGVVGLYLAYVGWGALAVGAFAAFLLGGVFGLALIVARRAGRRTAIPFGPWMLAGAWVGILAGETVGRWYTGFYSGV